MVDARNDKAVLRLRYLKAREEKPFALMFPSFEAVRKICYADDIESGLLDSPESPIVLLRNKERESGDIAESVAPGNPYLGVMLPYTPLHHLMMKELGFPVVATSGNRSDEPICIDERDALGRLGSIADTFLVHDRPIYRHVDDSIARVIAGRQLVLRRARGYAPLPVIVKNKLPPILAVGAHLKNVVAIAVDNLVVGSQHIGDLVTPQAFEAFEGAIGSLSGLYDFVPEKVACDLHPDYISSKYAQKLKLPVVKVQHHYAHILSCMAENELAAPTLGISWDGTGYGLDNTIWGGEFLKITDSSFTRFGHLRTFRLPGGERAIIEPRRVALGLLYEIYGDSIFDMRNLESPSSFSTSEINALRKMLQSGINCPVTSSAGRLFDAISSIVGIRQRTRFEGQAAMELEFALHGIETDESYKFDIMNVDGVRIVDWEPMMRRIVEENSAEPVGMIAARFHNTLTEIIAAMAGASGEKNIVLSGGCYQNKYLTERAIRRLTESGYRPYWHQRIPPNDGGIALGQIMAAARSSKEI